MKRVLILLLTLSCYQAFAILPEGHDFRSRVESTWSEVKETVTSTVKKWWNDFNAPDKKEVEQKRARIQKTYKEPVVVKQEADATLDDVKKAKQVVKKAQAYDVTEKGRPADPKLKVSSKGVPYVSQKELASIKSVPRLDVGREDRISKADFTLPKLGWAAQSPKTLEPLPSAAPLDKDVFKSAVTKKVAKVVPVKDPGIKLHPVKKTLTLAKAKDFSWPEKEVPEFKEKLYKPLSEDERQMLAALILFGKGHCHVVTGLMSELSKSESTKYEALYHLGACADKLKLHEAAFTALTQILKSKKIEEYAPEALELLATKLHKDAEKEFYQVVKQIKNLDKIITPKSKGAVYYRLAKGAFKSGHFNRTWQHASKVPESSDYWQDAQLLASIGYFNAKKRKLAIDKLTALEAELEKNGYRDNNIKALVKTNLARMRFLHGNIEESLPLYVDVPKDHGLWVQALIEQGWAQLYMDDFAGAIGNMYSLHSPYFKIVYQPESFVVRTIGYLNICQYGDAYQTLSQLEEEYRQWYKNLNGYLASSRKPAHVYETVKKYLGGKSTENVENLPYQILREAARGREFLNAQVALNEKADESGRYNGIVTKIKEERAAIWEREKQAKSRFDQHKNNIIMAKTNKELAPKLDEFKKLLNFERDLVMGLRFQRDLINQSQRSYAKFQEASQKELDNRKSELKRQASTTLHSRMKEMKTQMARVLDNNEFLRYEVFAGSGENIRYQVSGGKTSGETRIPASIKPKKSLNWSFDGEFWEDEIGNYRSSLRNNCPQEQAMLIKGEGQ